MVEGWAELVPSGLMFAKRCSERRSKSESATVGYRHAIPVFDRMSIR